MEEETSKSQKKRDAEALKKIGVALIDLSPAKLSTLPLPDNLYKAIIDAKSIKSHGARRRHVQFIGKLMREADSDAIVESWQKMQEEDEGITAHFHEIELWRDKLIEQGKDALTEFIHLYPTDDIQHLRQLIKKAMDDVQKQRNTGGSKALFRFLRSIIK